jgi:hypothetical protein
MLTFLAVTLSATNLRLLGAASACLIIVCLAIMEFKQRPSRLLTVALGLAGIAGLLILSYAIAHLQAEAV